MASLTLGRFFAEVSPNTKHAFTGPENGTSATKIKGTHWNAAHLAPDFEMGENVGLNIDPTGAGTNEISEQGDNRWQKRMAQTSQMRIQVCVIEVVSGLSLALQYTTDLTGATGWTATGVSQSCAVAGNFASSWVDVASGIKATAGVLFRWVTVQA